MALVLGEAISSTSLFEETIAEVTNANADIDVNVDGDDDDAYIADIIGYSDGEEEFHGYLSDDGWQVHTSSSSESPSSASSEEDVDFAASIPPLSPLPAPPPAKRKKKKKKKKKKDGSLPPGFNLNGWSEGGQTFDSLPPFEEDVGLNFDVPDDANELFFFQQFLTDELIDEITHQTNIYATQYLEENQFNIKQNSRMLRFTNGTTRDRMKVFIAVTFLMGLVHKEDVKLYWSKDELIATPFFRTLMSRDDYHNHLTFLHLCDNNTYPPRGSPDYNPRKKLGNFYTFLTARFPELWKPHQQLSVDEGCIPFKGRISFKCFNPNKPNKYHMKTFKVVDSITKYCLEFDLYVGDEQVEALTDFGSVHDLVCRLCRSYMGKSHIIFMDNWYSSPSLFYNLYLVQTGACGTSRYRRGYPTDFFKKKLKERGDQVIISGNNINAMRIYDRKIFCILSTVHGIELEETGRTHWQTKQPIMKPSMLCAYNKYMGGVDYNDQLLQYSAYDRRSIKWWKKVAFRLLNLAMVNAFCLYNFWLKSKNEQPARQTKFRMSVIKQLLASSINEDPPDVLSPIVTEFSRLMGRHFIEKIPCEASKKQVIGRCQVCVPAERKMAKLAGKEPKKRVGKESSFQCEQCKVALCVDLCFKLFHTRKNFIQRYIDLKNADNH